MPAISAADFYFDRRHRYIVGLAFEPALANPLPSKGETVAVRVNDSLDNRGKQAGHRSELIFIQTLVSSPPR